LLERPSIGSTDSRSFCEVGLISESKCGVLQLSGLYKNSVKRGLI